MQYRVTGSKRTFGDRELRGRDTSTYEADSAEAAGAAFLAEHRGTAVVGWEVDEVAPA